ncbi:MAG: hypothetical protein K0S46_2705 [Moraxellaceae bacterium]|jgi:hypothetical protein|nr:hypothetical protein [Moraxellaceae bacterium]
MPSSFPNKPSLHLPRLLGWGMLSLLLTACGDDSSPAAGPASTSTTLRGTAAVGAAIVNGTLTARCADGSGFTATVTTDADGAWSGEVKNGVLPCALQISGGTPAITLHGFATSAGVTNVTPLTDLALALATTQTPATWFAGTPTTLAPATLDAAVASLQTALQNGGYTLAPGSFDPFGTAFTIGDFWDQVLDQLQAAIAASGGAIADHAALVELVKGGSLASLPDAPSGGGGSGSCSGATLDAFNAVGGPYQLFATFDGSGTPTSTFTARGIYGVMVDGDCSIAISTETGSSMYTLEGATPSIYNNTEGTGISLTYADGSQVFFTYDHAAKFASVFTYQDSAPLWSLRGPDTNRCPAQANTIATPLTMGAGPYVIAYADAGPTGHIGIDHRVDVTATFSENQGLFGYRASALEDWNHGCAKNHNSVGDSVIRIGKWRHGKSSLGYYSSTGIDFTQYNGFHYAIARAVTSKPATGSKAYTMPAGWLSEISSNALTLGGTLTCGGVGGACVTVNFATNTADIHITVTPAAIPDAPLSFIQSGAEVSVEQGMMFINGPNSTTLRLVLAGPNADHIVGSFVKGTQTGGSFGLRVPTI